MLRLLPSLRTPAFQSMSLFTSPSLTARQVKKIDGPKSVDVFNVSDVMALLLQDFTYATSRMNGLNLITHMLGEGKCGEKLMPEYEADQIGLLRKLNVERLTFLIVLALRYPGILEIAQGLAKARENTLLHPRHQPSIYFQQVEEILNISIHNRDLKKELLPTFDHPAVQEIHLYVKNKFGSDVLIAPYTDEEREHAENVKEMLKKKGSNPFEEFKSFNPQNYLASIQEEKLTIAADTMSDKERRFSL